MFDYLEPRTHASTTLQPLHGLPVGLQSAAVRSVGKLSGKPSNTTCTCAMASSTHCPASREPGPAKCAPTNHREQGAQLLCNAVQPHPCRRPYNRDCLQCVRTKQDLLSFLIDGQPWDHRNQCKTTDALPSHRWQPTEGLRSPSVPTRHIIGQVARRYRSATINSTTGA